MTGDKVSRMINCAKSYWNKSDDATINLLSLINFEYFVFYSSFYILL